MPSSPSDRAALVTGAGVRVGRTIALALAGAGLDVVVHYHSSADAAAETVSLVQGLGRRAVAVRADLSDPAEIDRLAAEAGAVFGGPRVLVNSAAVFDRAPLAELTAERWDRVLALNLRAPALLSRAMAPRMRNAGGGVIINIADVAGLRPWAHHLHYSVSKAGIVSMTQCLALELAPAIRVHAVAPGTVEPASWQSDRDLDTIRKRSPLGRLGTAEDVGRAVVFLASGPDSMTGQILTVDGGRSLYTAG